MHLLKFLVRIAQTQVSLSSQVSSSQSSDTSAIECIGVYFKPPDFLMPQPTAELMIFFLSNFMNQQEDP